jgi:hypothetical protein
MVVMDNLSAHRPKRIRQLIEGHGCELVYLPTYSPDYNPIEEAFAKIKSLLRKAAARSKEALLEAIGAALCAITAQDAQASSSMPDTLRQVTYCETCCNEQVPSRFESVHVLAISLPRALWVGEGLRFGPQTALYGRPPALMEAGADGRRSLRY